MNNQKTVLILGGSGQTGRCVISRFLQEGYRVNSLTRNPNKAPKIKEGNVNWFEGSLQEIGSLKKAAQGVSAIISCVGADDMNDTKVYTDVYKNVVPIMKELKIKRIMMITTEKDNPESPWMFRKIFSKMLKNIFENQIQAENLFKSLKDPEIKWTIVRLSRITGDQFTGGLAINEDNSRPDETDWTTPTWYAAEFLVEEVFSDTWTNKFVAVTRKRTPGCCG